MRNVINTKGMTEMPDYDKRKTPNKLVHVVYQNKPLCETKEEFCEERIPYIGIVTCTICARELKHAQKKVSQNKDAASQRCKCRNILGLQRVSAGIKQCAACDPDIEVPVWRPGTTLEQMVHGSWARSLPVSQVVKEVTASRKTITEQQVIAMYNRFDAEFEEHMQNESFNQRDTDEEF